jgi:hypothetical protein
MKKKKHTATRHPKPPAENTDTVLDADIVRELSEALDPEAEIPAQPRRIVLIHSVRRPKRNPPCPENPDSKYEPSETSASNSRPPN